MSTFGNLEPFDGGDFSAYKERLEAFLMANNIGLVATDATAAVKLAAEQRKVAVTISLIGKKTYATLKDLCLPETPVGKSYEELCNLLMSYYKPKVSEVAESYRFHQATQNENESVIEYANRLKHLAVHCNFGAFLPRALRDQFVGGVRNPTTKTKLLSEDRTFDRAVQIAVADEAAQKEAKLLHTPHTVNYTKETFSQKKTSFNKASNYSNGQQRQTNAKECYRCGDKDHLADKCKHRSTKCLYCSKVGHLRKMCLRRKRHEKTRTLQTNQIETSDESEGESEGECEEPEVRMCHVNTNYEIVGSLESSNYSVNVNIDGLQIPMEIDTGSAVTLLNKQDFLKLYDDLSMLQRPTLRLKSYTGNSIMCCGEKEMNVKVGEQEATLIVRVVDGSGPSLLGRDLLAKISLPWKSIFNVTTTAEEIVQEYGDLFDNSTIGKIDGVQVSLRVNEECPVFMKARTVPFAIRKQYEQALDKLEEDGIIERVDYSEWASPVVPIVKPDGSLRLCGDYSCTINKFSTLEPYPVPTLEDLMGKLQGGKKFTKLDLSKAYHQLELSPESKKYTTINTTKGLYQYNRLPFGVTSAVTIFQRTMENMLSDLPGCVVYIDDILITGSSDEEHLHNLRQVMNRLQLKGVKLKKDKFDFMLNEVNYLGFVISAAGISPTQDKVKAIHKAKPPTNVSELQSFIGMANYLRQFIPSFAEIMSPLYKLLRKNAIWSWGVREQKAFTKIKASITSEQVLRHYDPDAPLVLQADASSIGVGAVILQPENGTLKPVAFASRVLTEAEKKYSQIEKESLAIVFGVTKFRQYLLGRHFTLKTDHKPLITLCGEHKPVPQMASSRVKRWTLLLAAYDYTIEFIPGKENYCADYLSRNPVDGKPTSEEKETVQVLFTQEEVIKADVVAAETRKDPLLKKVLHYTRHGWVDNPTEELMPYYNKRLDITTEDDKLIWNDRVIIPTSLREILLNDLHAEHLGMVKSKQLARMYLWWPGLDRDIENRVKECLTCQETARKPPDTQQAKWSWPAGPWKRLHLDFAGPYEGKMFLVIVDAYSKYLEVVPMTTITSSNTIAALRHLFSHFGLPDHIVTDNGTQFTSNEFATFLRKNNIYHTKTAPSHPATNGLAERYVGHFKTKTTQMKLSDEPLQVRLDKFLFTYRVTPTTMGKSPAELLMNRRPKTRFDSLRQKSFETRQQVKIFQDNAEFKAELKPNQAVFALNFGRGAKWLPGIVLKACSPRNYEVQVGDVVWKRHSSQLRARFIPTNLIPERRDAFLPTEIPTTTDEETPPLASTTESNLKTTVPVPTVTEPNERESTTMQPSIPKLSKPSSSQTPTQPYLNHGTPAEKENSRTD